MKNLLLIYGALILFNFNAIAQCKLITYSHNLEFSNPETKHIIEKKICFNDNKGLSYFIPKNSIMLNPQSQKVNNSIAIPTTLFDKKNNKFLQLDFILDTINKNSHFNYYNQEWVSVPKELKNKEIRDYSIFSPDYDKSNYKRKLKITKTSEVKVINGYSCKLILVSEYGKEYRVWYSENTNYNWLFLNFIYELPGTVIQIERDNSVVLELLSIEDLDFEKIEFSPLDFFKILCQWY